MKSKNLFSDLKAGLIVFLVALPLCIGVAIAQKAPLFSGIISGVVGGIIVASISNSRYSVSGPNAGLNVVVLFSLSFLGSFESLLFALLVAGVLQIGLGLIKAGSLGYYFPSSVIKGMLSAIGILLIIKQLPHLIGYDLNPEGDESFFQADGQNSFTEMVHMFQGFNAGSAIIGISSLFILFIWQTPIFKKTKIINQIPGVLAAFLTAFLLNLLFCGFFPSCTINGSHFLPIPRFHDWQGFLSLFSHPNFAAVSDIRVYEIAILIAVTASLENLISIEAIDKLDPETTTTQHNKELIAQGTGNMLSALLGGLPLTSVVVRSSANIDAGAVSRRSSIFSGIFLAVFFLFFPSVISGIPLSAFAALLIFTGYKLIKPSLYKNLNKQGLDQFVPFMVTVVFILFSNVLIGVLAGIVASVFFIIRQSHKAPFKLIHDTIDGKVNYFIKLTQNITFIHKGRFVELFQTIPKNSIVYLDGGRSLFIDKDVLEVISAFKHSAHLKNIEVNLEEIPEVELIHSKHI